MQTTIEIKTIKALLHFAAKKDIRYYLQGVHIEQGPTGTYAVTTNGYFIAVARIDTQAQTPASVIVVSDHLASVIKGVKGMIQIDVEGAKVTIKTGAIERTVQAVDGSYPDWRRVIHVPQTGEQAYFNPDYLATVQKAAREYHGSKVTLYHVTQNGNSVGHCAIDDDLQVFVMPVHGIAQPNVAPWVATC
ncbi:DNA polymerase III, beta chain, central [uncultured Caudovirales phage]|uniref:DNA polymerase III, beta chain, central n=1 Tax=uncultured Caudovirales phage TaxID=2100421 RepID=A0A6J7XV55_9CAUD|nr:DNA polymerase III, beta chain, central [uncultured Caudovirales phage]